MKKRQSKFSRGFTLLELVVVIVIVGVLGVAVTARFTGRDGFDSRGFYDTATATVRFAQKTAVAWRRPVFVCVTANQVIVGTASGCVTRLIRQATGTEAVETAPPGVTLNTVTFGFDGLGRPVDTSIPPVPLAAATTITFTSTIAGDPPRSITVAAETGHITAN